MRGSTRTKDGRLRSPWRCGFSLIELVVVITIVVVLAGLLLPAVAQAKQAAQRMACATDQRQIYLALATYAGECEGCLPSTGFNVRPNRKDYIVGSPPASSSVFGQLWALSLFDFTPPKPTNGQQYCREPVIHCPSQRAGLYVPSATLAGQSVTYFTYSLSTAPNLFTPFLTDPTDPTSSRISFGDSIAVVTDSVYGPDAGYAGMPINVHNNRGVNATYADGHTEFVRVQQAQMVWKTTNQLEYFVKVVMQRDR